MTHQKIYLMTLVVVLAFAQLGGGSRGQYDEEARAAEQMEKERAKYQRDNPATGVAKGVGTVAAGPAKFLGETAQSASEAPITGTLEGARDASGQLLDSTLKGAYKVATLGMGNLENYEVQDPEHGSGEPTKIKLLNF